MQIETGWRRILFAGSLTRMLGTNKAKDLGHLLLEEGLITDQQLEAARETQKQQEKSVGRVLMDMGLITEQAKHTFLHKKFRYELVDIGGMQFPADILMRLSYGYAEKHRCVPIMLEPVKVVENNRRAETNKLVVAMEDPTDIMVLDEIRAQTGLEVHPVMASLAQIEDALGQYPTAQAESQAAEQLKNRPIPMWWRIGHPALFMLCILMPLIVGGVLSQTNPSVVKSLLAQSSFDLFIYVVLGWSLWGIVVWEVDGLIFKKDKK